MNVSFSVNDDILLALRESAQDFTRDMRFFSALAWYRKNKLPLGMNFQKSEIQFV